MSEFSVLIVIFLLQPPIDICRILADLQNGCVQLRFKRLRAQPYRIEANFKLNGGRFRAMPTGPNW